MKKILITILTLILFINVNARKMDAVNYHLNLDKNYVTGRIYGSAIYDQHESGVKNDGGTCTSDYECNLCSDDRNTYHFGLDAYALTSSGKIVKNEYLGGDSGEGGDATYAYCTKDDAGACVEDTICHNGTAFSISFNLRGLMDENVYGYKLVLTITAPDGFIEEYVINPASENENAKKVAGKVGNTPVIKQLDANIACTNQALRTGAKEKLACGSTNEVGINTGENCVNSTNSTYYSIACTEKIFISSTHSDNTNLKGGSGISHTVIVSSIEECGGTFNKDLWKNDYETLKTGYDSADNERLKTYYRNKMDKMESYISDYTRNMNSLASYTIDANAKFSISYPIKGGNVSKTLQMIGEEKPGLGEFTDKTEVKLGYSGVTNPYNFSYTNANDAATVTLVLPEVFLNSATGAYSYENCGTCTSRGNKYYLDKNIDTTPASNEDHKYLTYKVEVSGMGSTKSFDVVYDDCDIQLEGKTEYLYRAIDLENPFITNLGHKIGLNWKNQYFDFTKVASQTGNGTYSLSLSTEDAARIRKSNEQNPSTAYSSVCSGNNDSACSIIRRGK